jgi:signal transduction histidine kinase
MLPHSTLRKWLHGGAPLKVHLILLVVGAVVPLLIFTMVLAGRFVTTQRADIEAALRANATDLATAVDREFETSIAALQVLAESPTLDKGDLAPFYGRAEAVRQQRKWGTVVLLGLDGSQLLNLLQPLGAAMPNVGGRAYFHEVLRSKRPVVSELYRGSISGNWVVSIAVPVMRGDALRYVLLAVIYAKDMQALVTTEVPGTEWTRALVAPNGLIAARTQAPQYIGRRATPDFLERTSGSSHGTYTTSAVDGIDRFGAFARAPLSGWTAAVAVPASLIEGSLWRSLMATASAGAAVMLLGVLLALLVGHRIAREMAAATAAAEALAAGGATVIPDSRVTELQRLAAALKKSAQLLEQRDAERRQAHALEADARREAEGANHAKDHFLAVLSHELRTPLTPVLTGVALLQKQEQVSERGQEYLAMIRRNVLVESRLIDDLLDVTRIARGKLEFDRRRVELCSIIERAVEVCRADIEARRLHFGVDYGPRPYLIEADAARLQQVFWNVLKNAIKFTPRNGCVGIRCRQEDGHVVVQVMDSGIGIEAPELERIFDAFAQAERSKTRKFGGLGLGLAISKALVEAHGGSIAAQSEGADRGATFSIRLPVLAAGAPRDSKPEDSDFTRVTPAGRRELHVLLVEDHGDTADMTRQVLENRERRPQGQDRRRCQYRARHGSSRSI